jgi:hypothetical protein
MFKRIYSFKDMCIVKHKYLYCINKQMNGMEYLHSNPIFDGRILKYDFVYYGTYIEEHKANPNITKTMSFTDPNFTQYDFYICDDENELEDNIDMVKLKLFGGLNV